ncbi:Hypothetical predicted protein [Cloeon dipterum]|nr:Hypothetical predicted protein [Cloeon dipterum]
MSSSVVPRRPFATNGGPSPPPRTHRHHSWDNHLGEKRTTVYKRVTRDGVITTHTTYDDAMHFAKNALLADLQNTVNPSNASPGYGSLNVNGVSKTLYDRHGHSTLPSQQRIIKETLTTTQAAKNNNNLSELDTLLQDLSNAHYAEGVNGGQRPPSTDSLNRPTMDSLLDELSAVPNGQKSTPRHLTTTITIQETRTREGGPVASTATRELDDLMASLSDFKINASTHQHQTVTDSPYAKPNKASSKNQLDSMLGNLQADMSRQGVNTTQKGCCNACEKPIVGQVITALGKTWHPEHFTCKHCNQELGTRNFFERDGAPYCEPDYHNLFSPRCAYCNGAILDKCVTALDKTWHTEHFFCAQCGKQFGDEGFHEKDGKPYCKDDYFDMFAPKCGGCSRAIMENYISALNTQWHPDCFVCRDCRQPFHGGSFFDHEGQPYCETHYHAKRGSLCAGCHKPITGRCITAMFRKFHPEHFVCAFCLKQLNKGTFKEQNDKPYCHGCFEKLFG